MFEFGIYGVQRPILYRNNKGGAGILRGGGIKGLAPQPLIDVANDAEFEMTRLTLREVWNNNYVAVRKDKESNKQLLDKVIHEPTMDQTCELNHKEVDYVINTSKGTDTSICEKRLNKHKQTRHHTTNQPTNQNK